LAENLWESSLKSGEGHKIFLKIIGPTPEGAQTDILRFTMEILVI